MKYSTAFTSWLVTFSISLTLAASSGAEIKDEFDPAVYDEQCGMMEMVLDIDDISGEMTAIREDFCKYL